MSSCIKFSNNVMQLIHNSMSLWLSKSKNDARV